MPTLQPALDDIRRDLAALNSSARKEPPTWEEVQAALAKLRTDVSSFITGMRQLYDSASLVTSEFTSVSLAADSWKDLHQHFLHALVILERLPKFEPETDSVIKHTIGVGRSIVDQADQEYQSYAETAYLFGSPANAERLREAIEEAESGKLKEMGLEAVRSLTGRTV